MKLKIFAHDRYYIAKDWTPKKLEVLVDVPDHLSLEHLRGTGLQPGEKAQPEVCSLVRGTHLHEGPPLYAAPLTLSRS